MKLTKTIAEQIHVVASLAPKDSRHAPLTNIRVRVSAGNIIVDSTDRFCLLQYTFPTEYAAKLDGKTFYYPGTMIAQELLGSATKRSNASLSIEDGQLVFCGNGIGIRPVEITNYPPIETLWDRNTSNRDGDTDDTSKPTITRFAMTRYTAPTLAKVARFSDSVDFRHKVSDGENAPIIGVAKIAEGQMKILVQPPSNTVSAHGSKQ